MVQGVVVQMTTRAGIISPEASWLKARAFQAAARASSTPPVPGTTWHGKAANTVSLVWSSYSTSASASAVFSTTLHMTGLEPR